MSILRETPIEGVSVQKSPTNESFINFIQKKGILQNKTKTRKQNQFVTQQNCHSVDLLKSRTSSKYKEFFQFQTLSNNTFQKPNLYQNSHRVSITQKLEESTFKLN